MKTFVTITCLLFAFLAAGCNRPEPVTFCDDRAGLLSADRQERLRSFHRQLIKDADIHLLVVVLDRQVQDLDREAVVLFEQHRVGGTTNGARGVLLVVDPVGGQVRMEIGYDLEGIFPDGFIARIEREQMAPFFTAGRVADGIEASVELLVAKALGSEQEQGAGRQAGGQLSGGGGARVGVTIGEAVRPAGKPPAATGSFSAGATPEAAFATYLQVLRERVKDPELPLYTPETRTMLRKWLVTDGQQANELKNLGSPQARGEWFVSGELAVLRFPLRERQLPPYFFRRGGEGWMLDLNAMGQLLAFNHLNQWHLRRTEHPYDFAFRDITFDANGFPHPAAN